MVKVEMNKENVQIQDIMHMQQSSWWKIIESKLKEDIEAFRNLIIDYKWWEVEKRYNECDLLRMQLKTLEGFVNSPEAIIDTLDPIIKTDTPS